VLLLQLPIVPPIRKPCQLYTLADILHDPIQFDHSCYLHQSQDECVDMMDLKYSTSKTIKSNSMHITTNASNHRFLLHTADDPKHQQESLESAKGLIRKDQLSILMAFLLQLQSIHFQSFANDLEDLLLKCKIPNLKNKLNI
jgi:translation elongation factor EF-4